jgi:hypothetical protein
MDETSDNSIWSVFNKGLGLASERLAAKDALKAQKLALQNQAPASGMPPWLLPVGIGFGVLVLLGAIFGVLKK